MRVEAPIKKLLQGHPPEQVLKRDALAQPESVDWFVRGYLARGQGVGQT